MRTFIAQPETIKQCMKNTNDADLYRVMGFVLENREPFQPLIDAYSKREGHAKGAGKRAIIMESLRG